MTIIREAAVYEDRDAVDDATPGEPNDDFNKPAEEEPEYALPDPFGPAPTLGFDEATPESSGGSSSSSSSSFSPSSSPTLTPTVKPEAKTVEEEGLHYRLDASGRNYLYDKHGNRVYKKGTTRPGTVDTLRPRTIKQEDWLKLNKDAKRDLSDYLKKKDARPAAAAHARKRRPTIRHTIGQVSTLLCSIAAFMGGVPGETSPDSGTDDDNYSESEEDFTPEVDTSDDDSRQQEFPRMPCTPAQPKHRDKNYARDFVNACVARPVRPAEVKTNLKAQVAMQLEWDRLRAVPRDGDKAGVWDEGLVREWRHVRREAQGRNEKANVGLVFGIVVEKNHELPESDPARKYKGRAVFQGNNVRDEDGNWAIFQELGSSPATMEAARCADAYGMCPGHDVEQCDAEQAYTQATLKGTTTWIRLPRDQWPKEWAGMTDPVCPLILALYGHPDSGGHWEQHCAKLLASVGFKELRPWRSCFWHEELKLFLVVYVDDFKLAGPSANLKRGWDMIRALVKTDTPSALGLFLGCRHDTFTRTLPNSDIVVRGIEYNMEDFLRSCVERYKELTGVTILRKAATRRRSPASTIPAPFALKSTTSMKIYVWQQRIALKENRTCRSS
jgi:hypothetical protein